MKKIIIISLLFILSSCNTVSLLSATSSAIGANNDRRSLGTMTDDNLVNITLESWAAADENLSEAHLNFTVYDGVVLMTGEVPNEKAREYINSVIYTKSNNIRELIDETTIGEKTSLLSRAKDTLIDNKISFALTSQEVVNPSHIVLHTENRVVFLMGNVTEREGAKATEVAAKVGAKNDVKTVIKHFNYLANIPAREIEAAKEREREEAEKRERLAKREELVRKKKAIEKELIELQR